MPSSHDYADCPENAAILISMRTHPTGPDFQLVPRAEAKVRSSLVNLCMCVFTCLSLFSYSLTCTHGVSSRNVWRGGQVSVFDSGFMLGDGCWEGIRLHNVSSLCISFPTPINPPKTLTHVSSFMLL
jgi:hypothetical protein